MSVAAFATDHGWRKVELSEVTRGVRDSEAAGSVHCLGPDTSFGLRRAAGDEVYRIGRLGPNDYDAELTYLAIFGKYTGAPDSIVGMPLTRLMALPSFEVISAEEIPGGGGPMMRVVCEYGQSVPRNRVRVDLDPGAGWVIRRSSYWPRGPGGDRHDTEVEYGPIRDGIPPPRVVTIAEPPGRESRCEFLAINPGSTPADEFTLAYYGLAGVTRPRPAMPAARIGTPAWLTAVGILGLIVAAVVNRAASKAGRP